jgi:predicted HicB family RNase H-like nuclease
MKARGRPRLAEDGSPSVDLHIRLPSKAFDRVYEAAQHERVSMPEYIRRRLREASPHLFKHPK